MDQSTSGKAGQTHQKSHHRLSSKIELTGKVALVTGAGKRVGASIARRLATAGMRVAVHYRSSEREAEALCTALRAEGAIAHPFAADLAETGAAERLVSQVLAKLGQLDVLVPSAANFLPLKLTQSTGQEREANWESSMRTNLLGPWDLIQAAHEELARRRGSITLITCASTASPYLGFAPYIISKGAVQHMMRVLALEYAPHVRVNAVAPGTVLPPPDYFPEKIEQLANEAPLQCIGRPEDISEAVYFLSTAPFVTGQELRIDGGASV